VFLILLGVFYCLINVFHLSDSMMNEFNEAFKAQWSLYVPHSGYYMYRTVVTICTAQWSLYVPHSCYYMYHQVQHSQILRSAHTVYLCGSENKQRLFPYTTLTDWFL
jgi:hypothetical protein